MENSKQYLRQHDIKPKISFKETPKVTVKLLNDKLETVTDNTGKEIEGVKYLVEHEGEHKTIFTASVSLIAKLASCEENDVVTIEMKSVKGPDGGFKSHFIVVKEKVYESEPNIPTKNLF